MIYISHRGYISGVEEKLEIYPVNISKLLKNNILLKLMLISQR